MQRLKTQQLAAHQQADTSRGANRAGGFTLLEILIVVAIIGILVALSVPQIGQMITKAREKATRATMVKIHGLLEQKLDGFQRKLDRDLPVGKPASGQWRRTVLAQIAALRSLNYPGANERIAVVLVRANLYRENFSPLIENGTYVNSPDRDGNGQVDLYDTQGYLPAEHSLNAMATTVANASSSEKLHFILTQMEVYGGEAVGTTNFSTSEVGDTDGDGLLEFIDAWGNPLQFYLWPTRLIRPGGPGTAVDRGGASLLISGLPAAGPSGQLDGLERDPDDPYGLLQDLQAAGLTGYAETDFRTGRTYHVPLIVSAGADQELGLFVPSDTANFGHLANMVDPTTVDALTDNITNQNARAGGN